MQCALTDCTNEVTGRQKYCSGACKQEAYRNRKEDKRNKKLNEFVRRYHRHNKPVPGSKVNLGVVDETGLLRGVAIIGRPVARMIDDGWTLEVNRVATDGCANSCSALYGAARRIVFELGYRRLITYTLVDESGASMRGSGWKKVSEVGRRAGKGWQSRDRKDQAVYGISKWRWEATQPKAKEAPFKVVRYPWDLLDLAGGQ